MSVQQLQEASLSVTTQGGSVQLRKAVCTDAAVDTRSRQVFKGGDIQVGGRFAQRFQLSGLRQGRQGRDHRLPLIISCVSLFPASCYVYDLFTLTRVKSRLGSCLGAAGPAGLCSGLSEQTCASSWENVQGRSQAVRAIASGAHVKGQHMRWLVLL